MPPNLSEDEIDDLLYYARTGDLLEFTALSSELCKREQSTTPAVLLVAKDHYSGNGPLHMAAANGHAGTISLSHSFRMKSLMSLFRNPHQPDHDPFNTHSAKHDSTPPPQRAKRSRKHATALGSAKWAFGMREGPDR